MKFYNYLLLASLLIFISCEKEKNDDSDSDKPVEEFLLSKSWQVEKLTFTEADKLYKFRKNASDNDVEYYSQDVITFYEDGTGKYTSYGSNTFNIVWEYIDTEKTTIEYTINDFLLGAPSPGNNLDVLLENVVVTENFLKYAEIYTKDDNKSIISSVKRVAIPLRVQ